MPPLPLQITAAGYSLYLLHVCPSVAIEDVKVSGQYIGLFQTCHTFSKQQNSKDCRTSCLRLGTTYTPPATATVPSTRYY